MTEEQIVSWIFLATALASSVRPVRYREILPVADGINHAVPTEHEMQRALRVLTSTGLIKKEGHHYSLTPAGRDVYEQARLQTDSVYEQWTRLEATVRSGIKVNE